MFNNNGGLGGGNGPYDYIGSPQHAEAMRFEHEQALNRERMRGSSQFNDGVIYGANAAWDNANVQINQLKWEREQLILQVQGLQTRLYNVKDSFTETVANANAAIDSWKKINSEIEDEIIVLKSEKQKLDVANKNLKNQSSSTQELSKVITTLQEANQKMLIELRALRRNNEMT
ncbi:MAG: hypothetical protein C0508_25730 [Cyanobacteria bacterium PR.023]|nr:hypothetical protein [Cyanobacteria bacterium PR.023]MDZ4296700.1 hypothetical protein [Moraxellaceae bacterium]MDZ4387361.1 hypothetical protein [Moraxellaceae bacterium]